MSLAHWTARHTCWWKHCAAERSTVPPPRCRIHAHQAERHQTKKKQQPRLHPQPEKALLEGGKSFLRRLRRLQECLLSNFTQWEVSARYLREVPDFKGNSCPFLILGIGALGEDAFVNPADGYLSRWLAQSLLLHPGRTTSEALPQSLHLPQVFAAGCWHARKSHCAFPLVSPKPVQVFIGSCSQVHQNGKKIKLSRKTKDYFYSLVLLGSWAERRRTSTSTRKPAWGHSKDRQHGCRAMQEAEKGGQGGRGRRGADAVSSASRSEAGKGSLNPPLLGLQQTPWGRNTSNCSSHNCQMLPVYGLTEFSTLNEKNLYQIKKMSHINGTCT